MCNLISTHTHRTLRERSTRYSGLKEELYKQIERVPFVALDKRFS